MDWFVFYVGVGQFVVQVVYMVVDGVVDYYVMVQVQLVEQFIVCLDLVWCGQQGVQQVVFDWGQVQVFVVLGGVGGWFVDMQFVVGVCSGVWVVVVQYCYYLCDYFVWIEWFVDVVVGIDVQVQQVVDFFYLCGDYDYWYIVVGVQFVVQVYVIVLWQYQVQQYQVGLVVCECVDYLVVIVYLFVGYVGGGQVVVQY